MINCSVCGARISSDSKFCKECGSVIKPKTAIPVSKPAALSQQDRDAIGALLKSALDSAEKDKLDEAISSSKIVLTMDPNNTTAHSLLASLYQKTGNKKKAIQHLRVVVKLNPDSQADRASLEQLTGEISFPEPETPAAAVKKVSPLKKIFDRFDSLTPQVKGAIGISLGIFLIIIILSSVISSRKSGNTKPVSPQGTYQGNTTGGNQNGYIPNQYQFPQGQQGSGSYNYNNQNQYPVQPQQPAYVGRQPSAPVAQTRPQTAQPQMTTGTQPAAPKPEFDTNSNLRSTPSSPGYVEPLPNPIDVAPVAPPAKQDLNEILKSANTYYLQGNYDQAVSEYQNALKFTQPANSGHIYQGMAISYYQKGDYANAASAYKNAINAYTTQIQAGKDVDHAKAAIKSCQIGLQMIER